MNVTAGEDAVQAETTLRVEGGNLTLNSGGGSANSSQQEGWGNRRLARLWTRARTPSV